MNEFLHRRIADDLQALTQQLDERGYKATHGLLAGQYGYGSEYSCTIFEMHPYQWGRCSCDFVAKDYRWWAAHPHTDNCYQTELERRGYLNPRDLATEYGLPEFGCMNHCTCGINTDYDTWRQTNNHDRLCDHVRPNFHHKPSGLEIRWNKHIGSDMTLSTDITPDQWTTIHQECVDYVTTRTPNRNTTTPAAGYTLGHGNWGAC